MPYTDRPLLCRDCGSTFNFTAGEQTFYATRGLQHEPVRCASCRTNRRTAGPSVAASYVSYGSFASFGGRNPRQMHPATCAACKQMTEVPFMPRDDRPVYCSECFAALRPVGENTRRVGNVGP